jgi:hypothetical protein
MLIPILVVLAITLFISTLLFIKLRAEQDKSQRLENTISHMQNENIRELLTRVQSIMNGELMRGRVMGEWHTNCRSEVFAVSDHFLEIYPTLHTIQSWITIFEINLDGDRGEIWLRYALRYEDEDGRVLRGVAEGTRENPKRWIIEWYEGSWVITKIVWYNDL